MPNHVTLSAVAPRSDAGIGAVWRRASRIYRLLSSGLALLATSFVALRIAEACALESMRVGTLCVMVMVLSATPTVADTIRVLLRAGELREGSVVSSHGAFYRTLHIHSNAGDIIVTRCTPCVGEQVWILTAPFLPKHALVGFDDGHVTLGQIRGAPSRLRWFGPTWMPSLAVFALTLSVVM